MPDDGPPEGLFAVGILGVVLAAIGRAVGGQGGTMLAENGCVTTAIGAAIFGILLARKLWRGDDGRG